MKNIFNTIMNNYDHEQKDARSHQYVTYYETKEDVINEYKENERNIEEFEDEFDVYLNEIKFPILLFDSDSSYGGQVFDSDDSREDIMRETNDRFKLLNDGASVWKFEEYNVFEDTVDLLRFENKNGDILGYVTLEYDAPNKTINNIDELNKGNNPIEDGWEDGIGNTLNLNGWGDFEKNKK